MSIFATPRLPRTIASFLAVAGVASAFAAAAPSHAGAAPLQSASYDYSQMPDIDQQRDTGTDAAGVMHAGLPGQGLNYCVPTSALDAFGWLAQHGNPGLDPGVRDWTSPDNYEYGTGQLDQMGKLMMTNKDTGTSLPGLENGIWQWGSGNWFPWSFIGDNVDFSPDLNNARQALEHGAAVILSIGWYQDSGRQVAGQNIAVKERTGGHAVVMTGYGPEGITFVDPDDTTNRMAPSANTQVTQAVQSAPFVSAIQGKTGEASLVRPIVKEGGKSVVRRSNYINLPNYAGKNGYIEGWTMILPSRILSIDGKILKYTEAGKQRQWPLPTSSLADAQISPLGDVVYYAPKGSRAVYKADVATGAQARLTTLPAAVTRLTISPDGARVTALTTRGAGTVTNVGQPVGAFKPNVTTLPATQINPAALQAPRVSAGMAVSNPNRFDTAAETPSLLNGKVLRASKPVRATGRVTSFTYG
jgi:hypothetical protein